MAEASRLVCALDRRATTALAKRTVAALLNSPAFAFTKLAV
jgi:hypothetical protein